MVDKFSGWRIAGGLGLPLLADSLILVLAEAARAVTPSVISEIQVAGLIIGTTIGLIFLPRRSVAQWLLIAIPYCVVMLSALFVFTFWFLGVFYGYAL